MKRFYGSWAQVITGIISCLVSLLMVSGELVAVGAMAEYLLDIPYMYAIIALGGLIVLYSVLGGMRAVSYTDVLQILFAFGSLFLISTLLLAKWKGVSMYKTLVEKYPEKLTFWSNPKLFYKIKSASFWTLFGLFILSPPVIQRMLITKDKQKVRQMWYAGAFLEFLICCMIWLIAFIAIAGQGDVGIFNMAEYLAEFQKK